jgi:hypothetical protein
LDTILWLAADATELAVIALLLYRRVWRNYPIFLSYLVWDILGDIVLANINRHSAGYATWYLCDLIGDSILLFAVLVELTWSILRPIRASLSRKALIPIIASILILGAIVWPLATMPGLAGATGKIGLMVHLQQTVSILQILFLLALAGCSQFLAISFRDRELQIATGLGFFSFVDLAVALVQLHQASYLQYTRMYQIERGAYICTLLYWTFSFAHAEAARREFTPQMQKVLLAMAGSAHSTRATLAQNRPAEPRKQKSG